MQNACNEAANYVKTEQQDLCSREGLLLQAEEKKSTENMFLVRTVDEGLGIPELLKKGK